MDNIFFEGLKVGTIIEVTNLADMKVATVKPYVNVLKKKYFHTYKSPHQFIVNSSTNPSKDKIKIDEDAN